MASLAGRLLVAKPELAESVFARSVVLLLQHDDEVGALGVVLTQPADAHVADVLPDWQELAAEPAVVFTGGPVQPEAAICLGRAVPGTAAASSYVPLDLPTGPDPQLGTVDLESPPVAGLRQVRVFAGYSGWSPGQLEGELRADAWWVLDALPGDAFTAQPQWLWGQVLRRQGLPLALMATATQDPRLN